MGDMLVKRARTLWVIAIFLILAAILVNGCAGGGQTLTETDGQTLPQEVTAEYLLTTAGFKRLAVNEDTPKRQALLNSIPPGQLTTFERAAKSITPMRMKAPVSCTSAIMPLFSATWPWAGTGNYAGGCLGPAKLSFGNACKKTWRAAQGCRVNKLHLRN